MEQVKVLKLNIISETPIQIPVLKLNIISDQAISIQQVKPLKLNTLSYPSITNTHACYILQSRVANKIYIGYTTDFPHRLRQHNGELVGGAKKTRKHRPWAPICIISGFYENSSALRFEFRLQKAQKKLKSKRDNLAYIIKALQILVDEGDGSVANQNKQAWPKLTIHWIAKANNDCDYAINKAINIYI